MRCDVYTFNANVSAPHKHAHPAHSCILFWCVNWAHARLALKTIFRFLPLRARRCGRTSCETPAVANIGWPVRATPARRPAGGRRTQRDGVRPSTAQPNQDDASANVSAHPRVSSRLSLHSTCGHRLMAQRLCLCAHVYADTHTPIHRRSSSERARVGSTTRRIINFHYRSRTRLSQ